MSLAQPQSPPSDAGDVLPGLRALLAAELAPKVEAIDAGDHYPVDLLRRLGTIGAWRTHLPGPDGSADLWTAIELTARVGMLCGSTAFLAWCQNTLAWYVANTANAALRARYLEPVAAGAIVGGTGLSNPMKSFFGIETLKLKATPAGEGYGVRGALPWVSNLGPDHLFGTICAKTAPVGETVMILADCADPALAMTPCSPFLAMDGTGTYALQFRDVAIPAEAVLADPAKPFVERIRAGFVLLQTGMGLGLIADCAALMREVRPSLGAINSFLVEQPEDIEARLASLRGEIRALAATPFDRTRDYWTRVIRARLDTSELSLAAAQAAMLHCGARGYVRGHRAQRRLRESYFVAIVTPATKQLRKMLSLDLDGAAAPA